MATPETVTPLKPALELGHAIIEGKVESIEQPRDSEFFYYRIAGKAADEYSPRPVMQVSSPAHTRPFCKEGDIVRIKVQLSGFVRRHQGRIFITNTLQFVDLA
ncbi:MAG TPA: hypothetical protein V6C99_10135 [Oculatellaceae cyanobacterium]